jgi:hypothetical protein
MTGNYRLASVEITKGSSRRGDGGERRSTTVGVLLSLVNSFIPMEGSIKSILNAAVVTFVVLWLLNVFGLFHSLSGIHVGK